MAYKLINPQGTVHDFANKMSWGHNIEEFGPMKPYGFDEIQTQSGTWTIFNFLPIHEGDFIIRNMTSGKIGLYEIRSSKKPDMGPFGPDDCYECEVIFCGYYDRSTRQMTIFNGYGIHTSWKDKLPWRKK